MFTNTSQKYKLLLTQNNHNNILQDHNLILYAQFRAKTKPLLLHVIKLVNVVT